MRLVALEEHFLTPAVLDAWHRLDPSFQDPTIDLFGTADLDHRLKDLSDLRLQRMDASGIDAQVLSLTTPATQNLEPADAVALARDCNDLMAATVRGRPERFEGFATLPTPDPGQAVRELERAIRVLGLKGAMITGRTRDRNVDHSDFWPLYEAAAALRAPIYLHPEIPAPAIRNAYYSGFGKQVDNAFATLGWGWHIETGVQVVRLILSGVFDRFPDLTIVLGHWGEGVLFYLERIAELGKFQKSLKKSIPEYVRDHFYVTPSGMFSERYLRWSVEVIGADRIMFSTDYPYQMAPGLTGREFVEQADLSAKSKLSFASGNWDRLSSLVAR